MRLAHALTVALAIAASPALLPVPCRADEMAAPTRDALDEAIDRLGTLPSYDAVMSLTIRVRATGDADAILRVVSALRSRRGSASAHGLGMLADHPDVRVRESVLYAIADVGLRTDHAMHGVREARTHHDPAVRAAAYSALGAVGDAADVPPLLDDLASKNEDAVRRAHSALRSITGATLRCRERLWRQWWKEIRAAGVERLHRACDVIETGGDAADLAAARVVVEQSAWLDVPATGKRIDAWLDAGDARLRADGYRLAAKLRLGGLADTVRWSLAFESDAEARRAGRASAAALGISVRAATHTVVQCR